MLCPYFLWAVAEILCEATFHPIFFSFLRWQNLEGSSNSSFMAPKEEASDTSAWHAQLLAELSETKLNPVRCAVTLTDCNTVGRYAAMRYYEMLGPARRKPRSAKGQTLKYSDVIEAQSFSMDFENLDSQEPPAKRARQETELELPAHHGSPAFKAFQSVLDVSVYTTLSRRAAMPA